MMITGECPHPRIETWKYQGEPSDLWSCTQCRRKFVPLELEKDAARFRFERENRFQWFEPTRHWRLVTATGKTVYEGAADTYESAIDAAIEEAKWSLMPPNVVVCGSDCNERDELDKAEREITRLTAAARWRPIATAPRDGAKFIGAAIEDGHAPCYEIGWYSPVAWAQYKPVDGGLFEKHEDIVSEWAGFNNFERFTHWAPLPAPPVMPNVGAKAPT